MQAARSPRVVDRTPQRAADVGGLAAHRSRRATAWPAARSRQREGALDAACGAVEWLEQQLQLLQPLTCSPTWQRATAALVQGVDLADPSLLRDMEVAVQWDSLQQLRLALSERLGGQQLPQPPLVCSPGGRQHFVLPLPRVRLRVCAEQNTVLETRPDRVPVEWRGRRLWAESLLTLRARGGGRGGSWGGGDSGGAGGGADVDLDERLAPLAEQRLQQLQAELTAANAQVWSQAAAGDAWTAKVGSPGEAAAWLREDPLLRLGPLAKHMPQQLQGCRLANLLGSHGSKAIAAALLGASATVFDISPSNARYGRAVAAAAGADVRFVVADVLALPPGEPTGCYDVALLELGVLHYFVDLAPLMAAAAGLLAPGGRLLLRDFHPVSTKLVRGGGGGGGGSGKRRRADGDYFSQRLVESDVAFAKYAAGGGASGGGGGGGGAGATGRVRLRQWGLGEVVTAAAGAGLVVAALEEEPGAKLADAGLPKLFTLVAVKPPAR